ncbi:cryptochrome/photolyase family protein [Brevirhabdus sp.]|uniref:cryptochrome/photolyase family protein n=1 Tax=Brevirhabdus sp. TaxID=2004514 RepID=UPI0040597D19
MANNTPVLMWFRRDLRVRDNPALVAACASGAPVIAVFILDEVLEAQGAAPRWRLGQGVAALARRLEDAGSRLILRRGRAGEVLRDLMTETGARQVHWSRAYDPPSVARDRQLKSTLRAMGLGADSHAGHLLFEPWSVKTGKAEHYKVFTPFWKAVRDRDVASPLPGPEVIPAPRDWPKSDSLAHWRLGDGMGRGAQVVARYQHVGEQAAQERLEAFLEAGIDEYVERRNFPARDGTSGLSENLTTGEISIRQCWHAAIRAAEGGSPGALSFRKELVWREFAYHLLFHTPHIATRNWREAWDGFAWNQNAEHADVVAWKQGRTGIPIVDAAMREMYVTGTMHNRVRMIAASYLTKHLLTHWRIGQDWFAECLTDWDPASNALGWQWVAGSGPDAAPYFRIFNPLTQAAKFDPERRYVDRWIAEGRPSPHRDALAYFEAVPRAWGVSAEDAYPEPVVGVEAGRRRALAAYESREF